MSRLSRVLVVAVVAIGVAAPSAAAVPDKKLGDTLGAMWKNILEAPAPQNPFTPGVGPVCVDLGGVVAPFAAYGETSRARLSPARRSSSPRGPRSAARSRVLPSLAAIKPSCGRVHAP